MQALWAFPELNIMITTTIPSDWRELQLEVGRILEECGFTVEIEKRVQTVRGDVRLMSMQTKKCMGEVTAIICEVQTPKLRVPPKRNPRIPNRCDRHRSEHPLPVSLSGFQQGAFKASGLTNIKLVTWEEFQIHSRTWLGEYFSPQIAERLDDLLTYTEPFLELWFPKLSEADKQRYLSLKKQYDLFGRLVIDFTPYAQSRRDEGYPTLPIIDRLSRSQTYLQGCPLTF